MDLVGVKKNDLEFFGGLLKLDCNGKAICRRVLTKANRKLVEGVVRAPKGEGDGGAMRELVSAIKKEDALVTIDVGARVKVSR